MLSIPEFYAGKGIFITGGTGFVGKVLLEKLLRCCSNLHAIYLLVRPKKGKPPQERIDMMLKCPLFDCLREEQPNFSEKVFAIKGDILEPGLGICDSDLEKLRENVSIVFHSAATVRFDEMLRLALEMNVSGVKKVLHLSRQLPKLEALIHVSTAFANCDLSSIHEVVYQSHIDPQKLLDMLEWVDDDTIQAMTPSLIKEKPNTYTFTKHLAEVLLTQEGKDLPIAIVRPSIVGAIMRDPLPGWIDNYNGPSGIYVAIGKGLLKSFICDIRVQADIIPCDMVVNMLITAAWHTATVKPTEISIYHCTTGSVNPFTWGKMRDIVVEFFKRNPIEAAFRRPNFSVTTKDYIFEYWSWVSHMIPAYLVDFVYRLVGKPPMMVKTYRKLNKFVHTLRFFTTREWSWTLNNLDILEKRMTSQDKTVFYFDPRGIDWSSYIENYLFGTKTYVLNESESGLPAARANMRRLRNIRYCFNTIVTVILWRLLIARSQIARNLWYLIMGLVFKFVRFFHVSSTRTA